MAHLYHVTVTTNTTREVNVVAESPEEAQAKVVLTEGETVVETADQGEVVA